MLLETVKRGTLTFHVLRNSIRANRAENSASFRELIEPDLLVDLLVVEEVGPVLGGVLMTGYERLCVGNTLEHRAAMSFT